MREEKGQGRWERQQGGGARRVVRGRDRPAGEERVGRDGDGKAGCNVS